MCILIKNMKLKAVYIYIEETAEKENYLVQSALINFPKRNALSKIFNKNTLKVSYSCMGNIASIISSHNRNTLNPDIISEFGCNCRSRNECPYTVLMLKIIPMMKRSFIMGFLKHLLRSASEIIREI